MTNFVLFILFIIKVALFSAAAFFGVYAIANLIHIQPYDNGVTAALNAGLACAIFLLGRAI